MPQYIVFNILLQILYIVYVLLLYKFRDIIRKRKPLAQPISYASG